MNISPVRVVSKMVQSNIFWKLYDKWSRIYYAPLPLKLYIFQLIYQFGGEGVEKVFGRVEEWLGEKEGERIEKGVRRWLEEFGEEEEEESGSDGSDKSDE